MNALLNRFGKWGVIAGMGLGVAGCSTNAGNGALIGGAAGAGLGAIVGHNSHGRTAAGALVGGAIGAAGGALIGNQMDEDQRARAYRDRYDDRYYDDRHDPRDDPRYDDYGPRYNDPR